MLKVMIGLVLFSTIIVAFVPSCDASQETIYRGTGYVTATYNSGTQSYNKNVEVILGSPTECESLVESNPFSFTISGGNSKNLPEEGDFFIVSCTSISNPSLFEGCALLQYWTFALNNNKIQGVLTNNHLGEAAAINNFYGLNEFVSNLMGQSTGWPLAMAQGTSISGQIDDQRAELNIEGKTQDQSAYFAIQRDAHRER